MIEEEVDEELERDGDDEGDNNGDDDDGETSEVGAKTCQTYYTNQYRLPRLQ